MEDKPTCLVNVQGTGGVAHEEIVEELMAWLQGRSGLTKAMVVKKRGALRKEEGSRAGLLKRSGLCKARVARKTML